MDGGGLVEGSKGWEAHTTTAWKTAAAQAEAEAAGRLEKRQSNGENGDDGAGLPDGVFWIISWRYSIFFQILDIR